MKRERLHSSSQPLSQPNKMHRSARPFVDKLGKSSSEQQSRQRQKIINRLKPLDLNRHANALLRLQEVHVFREQDQIVISFTSEHGTAQVMLSPVIVAALAPVLVEAAEAACGQGWSVELDRVR